MGREEREFTETLWNSLYLMKWSQPTSEKCGIEDRVRSRFPGMLQFFVCWMSLADNKDGGVIVKEGQNGARGRKAGTKRTRQ